MITSHHQQFSTALSPTQETATFLYNPGLYRLGQSFGKKAEFPRKQFQDTQSDPNNYSSSRIDKDNAATRDEHNNYLFVIDREKIFVCTRPELRKHNAKVHVCPLSKQHIIIAPTTTSQKDQGDDHQAHKTSRCENKGTICEFAATGYISHQAFRSENTRPNGTETKASASQRSSSRHLNRPPV